MVDEILTWGQFQHLGPDRGFLTLKQQIQRYEKLGLRKNNYHSYRTRHCQVKLNTFDLVGL